MDLVTAEEMRALDRATIESGHASGETLMERAGAAVAEAMERHYGTLLAMRVLVLCGPGNNGGDGFVAARHLVKRGADVSVVLLGDPSKVAGDARTHRERLESAGVTVAHAATDAELQNVIATRDQWDLAVDALLGTGARSDPEGAVAAGVEALRLLDDAGTAVIAVDLPTGVAADTGAIARRAVRADLTVTFGNPKRGHFLYPGRAFVGALEVADIGLLPPARPLGVSLATAPDMAALLPGRDPRAHKGSAGQVVVIGGSVGLTGAVALAARAALRTGAGLVRAAIPTSLNDILEMKLTEEMTVPLPQTAERTLAAAALEPALAAAEAADAVALGSGLSRHREAAELARRLVARCERPLVIDADGLNAFEGQADLLARGAGPRVLTPHLGEMRRLTAIDTAELEAKRIDLAREWAKTWRSVVVLKGAPTVTASAEGHATINPTGNPGLATAGSGDVLTGVIASLIAQGLTPYDAARLGVYLHGMAGDLVAAERGQAGMTASDVLESLPLAILGMTRLRAQAGAPATRGEAVRGPAAPASERRR